MCLNMKRINTEVSKTKNNPRKLKPQMCFSLQTKWLTLLPWYWDTMTDHTITAAGQGGVEGASIPENKQCATTITRKSYITLHRNSSLPSLELLLWRWNETQMGSGPDPAQPGNPAEAGGTVIINRESVSGPVSLPQSPAERCCQPLKASSNHHESKEKQTGRLVVDVEVWWGSRFLLYDWFLSFWAAVVQEGCCVCFLKKFCLDCLMCLDQWFPTTELYITRDWEFVQTSREVWPDSVAKSKWFIYVANR